MSAVPAPSPTIPVAPRRRRWLRFVVPVVVLLAAAAWFAPAVVARTGLRDQFARQALADFRGTVTVGGASLGWLSPVELRDVTVTDAQGRTLLAAPKVTSSKSLLALARDRSDLGTFAVERPVVEVVCEKGSTNLEDALANYLKDDGAAKAPTRPAVAVHVTGGTLTVRDAEGGKASEFGSFDATVGVPAARAEPIAAKVAAVAAGGSPGKLDADVTFGNGGTAKFVAAGFPLDALAPALRRAVPRATLAGTLTADLSAAWGMDAAGKPTARLEGTASARNLEFGGPWLNGDRLKLAVADFPVKIETAGGGVRVERAELTCDIGRVSAVGAFDPADALDQVLDRAGVKVEADVDLAKLATLLPKLLRVRGGTAIREGRLVAKLGSRTTAAGTVWDGEVHTSALKAERDGKQIEWPEPLGIAFSGRIPPGHLPTFDSFVCKSDFIAVNAQGSPEAFRAAANVYLDRLSERLGEFVELGGARMSGEAAAWVIASRARPGGAFKADAGFDLKQFAYADGARHTLAEKALTIKASAAGTWPAHGAVRVESGSVALTSGADGFAATLLEPIPDARTPTAGKANVKLTGDLTAWVGRVRGFVRVPPHYVFGGTVTASGVVRVEPGSVVADRLLVGVERARFRGAGLDIDEPYLNAAADVTLNRATGGTAFANVQLTSLALSVTEGTMTVETPADAPMAVGASGRAVADLNRLGRTLRVQSDPAGGDALHGRGTGPVRFRWQGDTTTFGGTLAVTDFAYGRPEQTGIAEAALSLDLDGQYDETPDRVTLRRAKLDRPGLGVDAKGTAAKFATTLDVALDGTIAYDLALLTPDLRKAVGGGFRATGKGARPFAVSGSLAPGGSVTTKAGLITPARPTPSGAPLTATGGIGWDLVNAYGFDVGPSELTVKVANGVAAISPITATFGGGRVTLTPTARLTDPAELSFAKGTVVDRAKLTPAACASALGYALPVIANAAHADGEISAVLDDNRVPLADPTKATLKGRLVVHRATVGAGPVVTVIVKLLGQSSASVTLANEMTVPVRVENGRVYHENLALTVNGYVVKTSGSVGFDGSLALVADVPIPGTFPGLKNNPALKTALEGKIVKVPIAGTMAKPVIDPRGFQAAVAGVARDAAKTVGKDLVEKELGKLFPGGLPLPGTSATPGGARLPFPLPFFGKK